MIVIKKSHYVIALLVLVLVVAAAIYRKVAPVIGTTTPTAAAASENGQVASSAVPQAGNTEQTPPLFPEKTSSEPLVGVWIPYMSLSTPEKTEEAFKAKYDTMLDTAAGMGVNAVFVHVRPFADSLYPSEYEPWSHILTGTQGEDPGYDPLAYMVEKAHEKGMAFHAWINPLRISTAVTPSSLSKDSFYMQNKDTDPYYFIEYNDGIYYNPASAYIRGRIADGAAEIAEKYNVDGIHFDDYFYPTDDESIDAEQYAVYVNDTEEPLPLHEWRTVNINALIATVYHRIKQANPNVAFGISPQGNLKNNEKINADVYTWCAQQGYIDYICPQLYYSFENPALAYETALEQWSEMTRLENVQFYIGLAAYKAGTDADEGTWLNSSDTIARQIETAKKAGADGILFYAIDHFTADEAEAEMANAQVAVRDFAGN